MRYFVFIIGLLFLSLDVQASAETDLYSASLSITQKQKDRFTYPAKADLFQPMDALIQVPPDKLPDAFWTIYVKKMKNGLYWFESQQFYYKGKKDMVGEDRARLNPQDLSRFLIDEAPGYLKQTPGVRKANLNSVTETAVLYTLGVDVSPHVIKRRLARKYIPLPAGKNQDIFRYRIR